MVINPSVNSTNRSIGDPTLAYESLKPQWSRARAVLNGEDFAKSHDKIVDTIMYTNLLIPFSPTMTQEQYNFYKAEAELPGLVSQYAKTLKGGLLRKPPSLTLPTTFTEEAREWLLNDFTGDNQPLIAFLEQAILEELTTSRAVISVDYPEITEEELNLLSEEEKAQVKPYPVLWQAENIINWQVGKHPKTKVTCLTRIIFRLMNQRFTEANPYHPEYVDTVLMYYLDEVGNCCVQSFKKEQKQEENATYSAGQHVNNFRVEAMAKDLWTPLSEPKTLLRFGKPIETIPVFFLNGLINPEEPILLPLVDREISLYNKVSRRNHLLYGASTYTPVVHTDMSESAFAELVAAGLGSWIRVGVEDKIDVLRTPTEALADMEKAIESTITDLANMGIRILSPEGSSDTSGIALTIRNSAQVAQLGTLNTRISDTMKSILCFMLKWRYEDDFKETELKFTLSDDFNPSPIGADWLRLVTEWYESRLIPRSAFINIVKAHDILPSDYDDEEGIKEMQHDIDILGVGPTTSDPTLQQEGITSSDRRNQTTARSSTRDNGSLIGDD